MGRGRERDGEGGERSQCRSDIDWGVEGGGGGVGVSRRWGGDMWTPYEAVVSDLPAVKMGLGCCCCFYQPVLESRDPSMTFCPSE